MPPEVGPSVPAAARLSRRGLSATESARARAAAGRDLMLLLSDATARYDDLSEGQLGDVLFEDNRTVFAVFGSKCDRGVAGDAGRQFCHGKSGPTIWELDPLIDIYKYHRCLKGEISISSLTRYRYLCIDIYIKSDAI